MRPLHGAHARGGGALARSDPGFRLRACAEGPRGLVGVTVRAPFPVVLRVTRLPAAVGRRALPRPAGLRSHGERLRLGFRGLRWRETGPGAHHGASEGADCRSQRAGAAAEDDRQVFPEVHWEAGGLLGQFGAEVHRYVHGPIYGRLEHCVPRLQLAAAAGTSQYVIRRRGTIPGIHPRESPTRCRTHQRAFRGGASMCIPPAHGLRGWRSAGTVEGCLCQRVQLGSVPLPRPGSPQPLGVPRSASFPGSRALCRDLVAVGGGQAPPKCGL